MLKKYFDQFLDYVFPIFCLGCDKEGELVCAACFDKIQFEGLFCCPVCHKNSPNGKTCDSCQSTSYIFQTIALIPYHENSIFGKLIQAFKYDFSEPARTIIGQSIDRTEEILNNFSPRVIDYIIPVPLHRRRQAERGFNQAQVVAQLLSKKIKIPLALFLTRSRSTKQQAKLSRAERKKNVSEAFTMRTKIEIKDKTILLVDDVYTTGSTLQECAKVLINHGAQKVIGFTLARG